MNSFLVRYKMGELCHVKHGYPFDGSKFDTQGKYIVLTPGNFYEKGGFKRTIGKEKWYSDEFPKEYLCHKGDLIVAMTQQAEGLLGSTAIVPEEHLYLHNQRIGLVSHNAEIVDKLYLYYLFMTKSVRKQIADSASGTKIKHTSPDKIYAVEVYVPDIDTQKKNAQLLYSLDKKIDENAYICAELEAMAKTLYDYWFVQFDFPDKNGRPYRTSGGEMEWNAQLKQEIPKGWQIKNISDICEIISGYPFQSATYSKTGKYRLITIKNVQDSGIDLNVDNYIKILPKDLPSYCILSPGDILMSLTGNVGRVGLMYAYDCLLNQRVALIKPKHSYLNAFLYFIFKSDRLKILMENISTGTSQKNLSPVDTGNLAIAFKDEIVKMFCDKLQLIITKIVIAEKEKAELTKLRDWLLPMLMNGQARVE